MALSERLTPHLRLPLIAAPMFLVSGPELVIAACRSGVIGAFPTINCRTVDALESWLARIARETNGSAPFAANLVVHPSNPRLREDLELVVRFEVPIVITSVGNPAAVVEPIRAYGGAVFADVATVRHAEKAAAAGVDGLVLLTAGAGGQTGWANPFAFVRAVRRFYDRTVVLAGGIADGPSLRAAEVLGADLAYMGTRFIATRQSMASEPYRSMLVGASLDDIKLTKAVTGLQTSILTPSLLAAGIDPNALRDRDATVDVVADLNPDPGSRPKRWKDVWSAGHSVSMIDDVPAVETLVDRLVADYAEAAGGPYAPRARPDSETPSD